jgi:hypothetical protein
MGVGAAGSVGTGFAGERTTLKWADSGEEPMSWYAYCITEQQSFHGNIRVRKPFPIEGLHGVGGAQAIAYPSGDFVVVVSEYLRSGMLHQGAALEHARVISECFKNGTVLPFKFATVFDNEEAIRHAVRVNRKAFVASVAQLRGKAEMHLKVVVPGAAFPHSPSADSELPSVAGAEYLSKLHIKASLERERQTKARSLSQRVNKLFNPLDEEVTCKQNESGDLMIGIAHLIDSNSVTKYQNRFSAASKQFKDCELMISGPWPPFHFLPDKLRTVHGDD